MILLPPKGGSQQAFTFDLPALKEAFETWQNDLEQRGNKGFEKTNKSLLSLCQILGDVMEEGLRGINTPGVIFIPHGFLHLAPLHAALVGRRPLFEQKTCLFLPAWWLCGQDRVSDETGQKVLLTRWKEASEISEIEKDLRWKPMIKECTPEDYIDVVKGPIPPDFLAFYCHGRRHYSNPYLSALELYNQDLTLQDLIHHTPKDAFKGSRVLISACESDLGAGARSLLDEHLSIASAFLLKGAFQVCGSLYRGMEDFGRDLLKACLETDQAGLGQKVHEVQQAYIKNDTELSNLYKSAAYRVVGLPDIPIKERHGKS